MFNFLRKKEDIDKFVEEFKNNEDSILLDVREENEFKSSHIDGAINIPLGSIENAKDIIKDRDKKIYTYCTAGVRSKKAVKKLHDIGFNNAVNIGGIKDYTGETVK